MASHFQAWLTPPTCCFGAELGFCSLAFVMKWASPFLSAVAAEGRPPVPGPRCRLELAPKKGVNNREEGGFCAVGLCPWVCPR